MVAISIFDAQPAALQFRRREFLAHGMSIVDLFCGKIPEVAANPKQPVPKGGAGLLTNCMPC
jgi:hypothetical protein